MAGQVHGGLEGWEIMGMYHVWPWVDPHGCLKHLSLEATLGSLPVLRE
jgi:hypothetical protein